MDFDTIRPIISGLVGGAIATYLCSKWAKDLPRSLGCKDQETLLRENKIAILAANTVFMASLIAAVAAYQLGYFHDNDWRGFGLFGGFAFFSPLLCLAGFSFTKTDVTITEAVSAYSINQKTPTWLLFSLFIAGAGLFFASIYSLFF